MVIHYQEYGDENAPLMVFLHGGGVSSWMWKRQIDYFTNYHCVAVDLPEHGLNNDKNPFTIQFSAEKIIELIEKLVVGNKKIILIGFSLGAQVAINILSIKPNLIDYAIINSALVRPTPFAKRLIKPTIQLIFPVIKNRIFSKLQAKTLYINDDFFEIYYKETLTIKRDALIRVLEENMSFQIKDNFKNATAKILVTVGAKEKSIMKKSAYDIISSNPNCKGVIIAKVGHGLPLAKPDFFNQMVEKWIQNYSILKESKVD